MRAIKNIEMNNTISDWLFHAASAVGSLVYVLIRPDSKWWLNITKWLIGYSAAIFISPLVLAIFQYLFKFSGETYQVYAIGYITGVLGMTFFEAVQKWLNGEFGMLLTEIIKSWLKRPGSSSTNAGGETENSANETNS